jgi:hypothetical protein
LRTRLRTERKHTNVSFLIYALPDDGDCTKTCRSCFNVNFNVNFKTVFKTIHLATQLVHKKTNVNFFLPWRDRTSLLSRLHDHIQTEYTHRFLWTSDRPVTETSTCTKYNTRNRQSILRRNSNPQSQEASFQRPTP